MRALITGASGLVGSAVSRHLAEAGWQVVGLARTSLANGTDEFLAIDIGTAGAAEETERATSPCEVIVHAAASRAKDDSDPEIALANCLGTQQMLELGQIWGVRRFVYLSGVTVIGSPVELPISEDHPTAPATAYHASKLYGEELVRIASGRGVSGISLRLTAPIGPGMPAERIVSAFVRRALADEPLTLAGQGKRRQNYVDVRDAARAIELAAGSLAEGAVNVGGTTISNRDLAELCRTALGSASPIEFAGEDPEEGMAWEISLRRAESQLGYAPRRSLEDSIREIATTWIQHTAEPSTTES